MDQVRPHLFLQGNINHCAGAQDLLLQALAEWGIDVAVVAEPYFVPPRPNWAGDLDGSVAVVAATGTRSQPLHTIRRGSGYVAASWGSYAVIGAYFSPNRGLSEFESCMAELEALVRVLAPRPVILLGDLNAKSTAWGEPATDRRGELLEEWALGLDFVLLNRGRTQTCVRHNGGSIVDLSFCSQAIAGRINDWRVVVGMETLSDHRYIRFSVSPSRGPRVRPTPNSGPPRWAIKRIDRELLIEAAIISDWCAPPSGLSIDDEAELFRRTLTSVCDAAMPRVRRRPNRRAVYWWSPEIAVLREACVEAQRRYTRHRSRHRDEAAEAPLYRAYRTARSNLRLAILQAKAAARQEMYEELNRDPWGRPYLAARNKLRVAAPPITESMEPQLLRNIVSSLFPSHRTDFIPPAMGTAFSREQLEEITEGEFEACTQRLRTKTTAPGPDGVPARAIALAVGPLKDRLRGLFNACLVAGRFPKVWKTGQLVLLRKEGRPADSPSGYRPIVLLDEAGKLFERVIAARIVRHLTGTGPDLSASQFGFRAGRSTLDALSHVRKFAAEAAARGGMALAVSLDIANAFNSLPHQCIESALRYHGAPLYLQHIVADYLRDRHVAYSGVMGPQLQPTGRGVPQGLVLGPLLWNIGYDWVLRGALLCQTEVVCYADDTLVLVRGTTQEECIRRATCGVQLVVGRIRMLGLDVALGKTEALLLHGPRSRHTDLCLTVEDARIPLSGTMKYLGLVLDGRLSFREHFQRLAPRLRSAAAALGRLLPNVGGPDVGCRRLYASVIRSMALYGAPIWSDRLTADNRAVLLGSQRAVANRIVRAYRTVGHEAACVLAGTPPWDLDAKVLTDLYTRCTELRSRGTDPLPRQRELWLRQARLVTMRNWELRLARPSAGRATIEAIRPHLQPWVERRYGLLTYRLTQILTGHGAFGHYLCRVARREGTTACHQCGASDDTALHTLAVCPTFAEPRAVLQAALGGVDVSALSAVVASVLSSRAAWDALSSFCETVMSQKEAAERAREDDPDAPQIRRRRVGRRRAAHERDLPP